MSWQSKIYHKYRFDEKGVKIVSDFTGLLSHPSFLQFLDQEKKPWLIAESIPGILDQQSASELIILIKSIQIPAFITSRTETINFRFSDIPVNGNASILAPLSTDDIVALLDYVDEKAPHFYCTDSELQIILNEAGKFARANELKVLAAKLQLLLGETLNIDNILEIALVWADLQYKSYQLENSEFLKLMDQIDEHCNPWFMDGTWQEAFYFPVSNPKTVDKILHNIKSDKRPKKALLCFDCMGLPEWLLLKDFLCILNLSFEESSLFTLLPSITGIARSAIYTGTYEVYSKKNPGQAKEEADLKNFFGAGNTLYLKDSDFTGPDKLIGYDTISVLFKFFDDFSHSAPIQKYDLTKFGYYNAVNDYLKKSRVKQIIKDLLEHDFTIYICSDHGSTIAVGNGNPIEQYLIDTFAKRATIISKDSSNLTEYQKVSIPFIDDKVVVIPGNREMFARLNQIEINHGGISIEEMVVPFVKILNKA